MTPETSLDIMDRLAMAFPWIIVMFGYIIGACWYLSRKPLPEIMPVQAGNEQSEVAPKIMVAIVASAIIAFVLLMELIRCDAVGCYPTDGKWVGDQDINRIELRYRE